MQKRMLGRSGLEIAPLVFGGNVFGWTADEKTSCSLLDAWVDAGLDAVDTADVYSAWVPGNHGGESETLIGNWLARQPAKRGKVTLITKVGSEFSKEKKGLSARWIMQAVEDSLRRLRTDYIDLYLSHWFDPETPYEETLGAYRKLLEQGKIRAIGASNLNAQQLSESLQAAGDKSLPRYDVLQPEYNLYNRAAFDGPLAELAMREDIGVITYSSLASGFLTGKYRSKADLGKSVRGERVAKYLDARGARILDALEQAAQSLDASMAEVALAWVMARPGVTAPIASATSLKQLNSLLRSVRLELGPAQQALLDEASR
ncbi:aldo/keto reductase [Candidimonas nitroreducens]|uniref:Alcohol dehydrogenase n=1 Tax=Candidimonas nitroreducens TaxID=683354 RepID=A0A225M9B6_9BURK|nr:aldo/keto reductase [Candidimonas nitroreducens]OWT56141.1 alcohol dehydrogenase [Candidimonas nitroreducens]